MKTLLSVMLGLGLLVLTPSSTWGGGYCRSSYRATYVAPYKAAVVHQAYTPVYQDTYLQPFKVFTNPDYYSSVSDYYRDKLLVDAVAGKTVELLKGQQELQALKEEVQALRRQLLLPQGGGNPPPPAPIPEVTPKQQVMPRAQTGLTPTPEKLRVYVQQSCLRCHGANSATAGAGIDLSNLDALPKELRLLVNAAIVDGSMPKGGKPATDEIAAASHFWATGRSGEAKQK